MMGVSGAFHMGLGRGARPESPLWCGRGAISHQDRVPGPAALLLREDQLLGGVEEGWDSRDGRHRKAISLVQAEALLSCISFPPSAELLSEPL